MNRIVHFAVRFVAFRSLVIAIMIWQNVALCLLMRRQHIQIALWPLLLSRLMKMLNVLRLGLIRRRLLNLLRSLIPSIVGLLREAPLVLLLLGRGGLRRVVSLEDPIELVS